MDKKEKIELKPKFHDLFRTTDSKITFSKGDITNWSYKLCKITKIVNDTIPSYKLGSLPERYIQALLTKRELTLKEKIDDMKALRLY